MTDKPKIAIAIPVYSQVPADSFMNLIGVILENLSNVNKFEMFTLIRRDQPISKNRNIMIHTARQYNATHIWFIDSDMILKPKALEKLLAVRGDIVSGLAFKKFPPYLPAAFKWNEKRNRHVPFDLHPHHLDKVIDVDAVGMSCCLIDMKVFEKIAYPWFLFEPITERFWNGEDIYFCKKARNAGYQIKLHTGIIPLHVGGVVDEKNYFQLKNKFTDAAKEVFLPGQENA